MSKTSLLLYSHENDSQLHQANTDLTPILSLIISKPLQETEVVNWL